MPQLEQSATNSIAKYQARTCTATFTNPTTPGSLVLVVVVTAGALPVGLVGPAGFTLIRSRGLRDLEVGIWYRQNAPATVSVSAGFLGETRRSIQVRAMEYSGVAQSNSLDKVVSVAQETSIPFTGATGTVAQADELVVSVVANQYASTGQAGFVGGLAKLFESASPLTWANGTNYDWERARFTIHQTVTTAVASFSLVARLSSTRRWCAFLITFRGASSGPARFTSRNAPPMIDTSGGGRASLTVFGPLRSTNLATITPMIVTTGTTRARIGPYDYQYRVGGWQGLLIGDDTPYQVENVEGLEGWQVRTSDDDLPRGDGALRGSDLQAARTVLFKLKVGGTQDEVEEQMAALYRSLIPQRDQDWELIWRYPGRPLRTLYCRPIDLTRELSWRETLVNHQGFALRAADPRHYSALTHRVEVPVSLSISEPTVVTATNIGNGPAYPLIRIVGPTSGPPVTRVALVNQSTNVTFDVSSVLPGGSVLVGDMSARATGAPRSIVTIDAQSKYGAWQHPRQAFSINPGTNELSLHTTPDLAPVVATVEYRDSWAG